MKYWIAVVSKDHLQNGVKGGFMQVNHGKASALKRIHKDDWIVFYSPKKTFLGKEKLQAFTAIGQAIDDEIYQIEMSKDFIPFRKNINFKNAKKVSIISLINNLTFIKNKKSWGFIFKFGFFEIQEADFTIISGLMLKNEENKGN